MGECIHSTLNVKCTFWNEKSYCSACQLQGRRQKNGIVFDTPLASTSVYIVVSALCTQNGAIFNISKWTKSRIADKRHKTQDQILYYFVSTCR